MRTRPSRVAFRNAIVKPDPIPVSDIVRGKPKASTFVLFQETDGTYVCGVWHCTPGVFHWTFGKDEFVYFLQGDARIRYDDGRRIRIRTGDAAHLPRGRCLWTVTKTVRKVFVARS